MFKGGKWRSEKNKIKAVFKVQFQATQVPETGWDSLLVALVPSETGKPSTKTDKVQVHNGACIWGKPVYETVKLSREPKTGKFERKKYHFIVSNGSSKGGILGQTVVDFAEYADAIEPCSTSLSLGASNSTILHITIQRLHADGNTRSAATISAHAHSARHQMGDVDMDGSSKASCSTNSCANKESQPEVCRIGDNTHHKEEARTSRSFSGTEVDILSSVLDHTDNEQGSSKSIAKAPSDEQKTYDPCTFSQDDVTKLIAEISELKKKNTSMVDELKEMQERYSDLSLKFAEVEGERQQLIMSLRNLKNAKRT